jgi:glucokinase
MILAGDIGGTNVRLALLEAVSGKLVMREEARFPSRDFPGLEAVVEKFLGGRKLVTAAGFGVAGAVRNGRCEATNLPWVVDSAVLARRLSLPTVALVNDLYANAVGLGELSPKDFAVVNPGEEDPDGNRALISAGTGLGEAFLVQREDRWAPYPSEGGHCSFAPRGSEEIELLRHLQARFGHVSVERVLSGPGLVNVYRFERERSEALEPTWLTEEIARRGDAAPVVARAALEGKDAAAERAMSRFVSIYGAEAGNLALKALATSGVFVGGGVAPKILPKLVDGRFFVAFCDKGRFGPLLAKVPVKVILNDQCALLGAARLGAESGGVP